MREKGQDRLLRIRQTECGKGHIICIHRPWPHFHLSSHTSPFICPFTHSVILSIQSTDSFMGKQHSLCSATGSLRRLVGISLNPPPPPPGLLPFLSDTKGLEQPESWNPFQKVTFPAVGILKTFWKTRNSTSPPRDQAHHPPADLHTPECPCLHPLDLWGYSLCRVAFPPVSTFLGPNTGHKASTKSYPLRWYEDSKLLQQKSLLEVPAGNANPRDPRVSN